MKPASSKKKPARKPAKLAPARRARATVRKGKVVAKVAIRKAGQVADDALLVAGQLVRKYKAKAVNIWHRIEAVAAMIERGITAADGAWQWIRLAWEHRHIILAGIAGAKLAF